MIELEGFAVIAGQEPVAAEWMAFLRTNQAAVNQTLVPEQLREELIFSTELNGRLYLCWYANAMGEPAQAVSDSANPVDQKHVAYWRACIDESVPSLRFKLENHFTNPTIGGENHVDAAL